VNVDAYCKGLGFATVLPCQSREKPLRERKRETETALPVAENLMKGEDFGLFGRNGNALQCNLVFNVLTQAHGYGGRYSGMREGLQRGFLMYSLIACFWFLYFLFFFLSGGMG